MSATESIRPLIYPVILSGGSGSRLWPVSRKLHPKPFMRLPDGQTLMAKTFQRASQLKGVTDLLTVTNRDLYFRTRDELDTSLQKDQCLHQHFLLEPCGRNTAPALITAALYLERERQINQYPQAEPCMLVMPADHLITHFEAFQQAVDQAVDLAQAGQLVTFGIQPTQPETGFGYIQAGANHKVKRFVEKPDAATAQSYLDQGDYYWNAGIFCFKPSVLIAEFEQHAPRLLLQARQALESAQELSSQASSGQLKQIELLEQDFRQLDDISIDYALLEKSDQVAVVPCDLGWSDIGSWTAYSELLPQDADGNRIAGDVVALNTHNCFIHSPHHLTATLGIDDLIIINTSDAVLVAHQDQAQEVRQVVSQLTKTGHETHLTHPTVHRPWGTYTTLEMGDNFQIKRIVVKPGQSLSLQLHHHRSEHWVVVTGMAKIVNEEQEHYLRVNESTFIPAGNKHRLENPGLIDLVLIEVQSGAYLGEDDIVRFQDVYGRH